MATIMLVHGGGTGSWIWKWVLPLLRDEGHDVFATTMTGAGDRRHLASSQVTLETNAVDVANALRYEDLDDCVLVGHSQSGAVLPGVNALEAERIRKLVFLDAILLHTSEAIGEAVGYFTREQCRELAANVRRGDAPAELDISAQQQAAPDDMPSSVDPKRLEWMFERLTGLPALTMFAPVDIGVESITTPAEYIACTVTPMTMFHERAAELGWPIHTLVSDHACMVSDPEKTAALLDELATG
jgi:pimeloyl-ACP methyl ester carboxylesterase